MGSPAPTASGGSCALSPSPHVPQPALDFLQGLLAPRSSPGPGAPHQQLSRPGCPRCSTTILPGEGRAQGAGGLPQTCTFPVLETCRCPCEQVLGWMASSQAPALPESEFVSWGSPGWRRAPAPLSSEQPARRSFSDAGQDLPLLLPPPPPAVLVLDNGHRVPVPAGSSSPSRGCPLQPLLPGGTLPPPHAAWSWCGTEPLVW